MYLFIFESLGAQELILVGIVALIVFGPRKLPMMARKAGEMMREFKSVSNEFKSTWEKEINFEETNSKKKLENTSSTENLFGEDKTFGDELPVIDSHRVNEKSLLPEIKEVSSEDFQKLLKSQKELDTKPIESMKTEKSEWF